MPPSDHDAPPSWHALAVEAICAHLGCAPDGLSEDEAARRLAEHGPNELEAAVRISPWSILAEQFKNVLIVILLVATGLSMVLGHGVESIAIAVIVLFAVLLGFVQEFRAERAIEALRKMAAPAASVIRDRRERDIPARDLVPGDVVLLKAGNKVPADGRLIEAVNLQVVEAALTGESVAVSKHADVIDDPVLPVGDRWNMIYAGTTATYGRGRALVVTTGAQTEFGNIAEMLRAVKSSKTPLQKDLDRLGTMLARAAFVVVAVIVVLGLLRGQPLIDMVIFGIALAVAVVPEALSAVVTISLAIGVQRLVKRHALMRRLTAVEALGSTSVICADKTGTLTKDAMTARRVLAAGRTFDVSGAGYEPSGDFAEGGQPVAPSPAVVALLQAAVLASDAYIVEETDAIWGIKGDPTEGALVVAAAKAGIDKADLDAQHPRVAEIPFTSETKRMTTLTRTPDGPMAYSKGALEVILGSSSRVLTDDGEAPLDDADRVAIQAAAQAMATEALRVLAVAVKADGSLRSAENDMTFLGLVGMIDPPRPEAKDALRTCEEAGIKTVMITGDHPLTAEAVARELGLVAPDGRVVTGAELGAMSDEALASEVAHIDVYARVSPADKLRVVTAWQERGHIVAMTGDGVNDAPALKKADIGIAMGISGTDVTREAAAMTLTDDNFASIVAAVEEGRGIFSNIKKYLMFLLSSNIGEIGLMAGATLMGLPLPLSAVQILYVNLATDGLPALALAVDPPEADLMRRRPRNPRVGIFTRPVLALMLAGGVWSTIVNLGLFVWASGSGRSTAEAMTMTFGSLVLIQFFKAYNFRSDRRSVLHRPFANRWLNIAIVWELALLVTIFYVPFFQHAMGTFGLTAIDWWIVVLLSATVSPVLEVTKWALRRGWFGPLE